MATFFDSSDDQVDKFLGVAGKEINEKLRKAYSYVGLPDHPSPDSEVKIQRKTAKLEAQFRIIFEEHKKVIQGPSQGIPVTTWGELPKLTAFEKLEVSKQYGAMQKLRERILSGDYRNAVLRNSCVGAITRYCGGCDGHGVHNCGNCSGAGQTSCPSCLYGKTSCPSCGGAGYHTSTHDSRVTATCNTCYGSGRYTCRYCGGTTTVTCVACRGGREVNCRTCAATGLLTDITGVKSTLECALIPAKSEFDIFDEQDEVVAWAMRGFKEAQKTPHKWLPSTNAHSVQPVEQRTPTMFTSTFPVEVEGTVISVDGKQHGVSMKVRHLKLDKTWIRFDTFLNSAFNKVTKFAQELSGEAPSTFMAKLKEAYKETASVLEASYKGKDAVEAFGDQLERSSCGAIGKHTAKAVATAYRSSIDNFAKSAAKQTAIGPFVIAAVIWVTTQLGGMPGIGQKHPEWFAPYLVVPAFLSWISIRRSVKKAIKRETGRTDVGVIGHEALVIPAAVLIIFGMTAYANLNVLPTLLLDLLVVPAR